MQTHDTLLLIFTAVTSIAVLLQAGVLIGMFVALTGALKKILPVVEEVRQHVVPILVTSRGLVEEVSPKVKVITDNVVEISHTVRHQVTHIDGAVNEVVDRTQNQAARVDGMLSETLNSLNRATVVVHDTVTAPIRQVSGVLNGVRAGLEVLRARYSNGHPKQEPPPFY